MKLLSLYLLAGAALLAGCSDEREGTPQVRIVPEIETRVTGMHFDAQDCIGLTIVRSAGVYVENARLSYDGSAFTASGLMWYADRSEGATFMAYYPYAAAGRPTASPWRPTKGRGWRPRTCWPPSSATWCPVRHPWR